MPASNPTTGRSTAARIVITSSAPTLILSPTNTAQRLTYQITAQVTDVAGNVQSGVQLYYDVVAGHDVATVSSTGLVTAEAPGQVIVQVSASAFNAHPGAFTPSGTPATGTIYAEQSIQVTQGDVLNDWYFVVSSLGSNQYQIQVHPETNSTWAGTITFVLGPPNSPSSSVIGTVTNSGTLNFVSSSPFIVTGTWILAGKVQTFHQVWSNWGGGAFPVMSVRASKGGFGVSGYSSASSGQPYTP